MSFSLCKLSDSTWHHDPSFINPWINLPPCVLSSVMKHIHESSINKETSVEYACAGCLFKIIKQSSSDEKQVMKPGDLQTDDLHNLDRC